MTHPASTSPSAPWSGPAAANGWCCPAATPDFLLLQPLGGGPDDVAGVFPDEGVEPATLPAADADDLGDAASTDLLRTALRVGFTSSAGPFRSLARLGVSPAQLPVRAAA